MKVKLYMDVFPGWEKPLGGKRLSFVGDVPDYLIQPQVDVTVQETSHAEEVK